MMGLFLVFVLVRLTLVLLLCYSPHGFFLCVFMCLLGYLFVPGAGCVLFDFLCYVASVVLVFVLIF